MNKKLIIRALVLALLVMLSVFFAINYGNREVAENLENKGPKDNMVTTSASKIVVDTP